MQQKRAKKSRIKRLFLPLIFLLITLPILVAAVVFGFSDLLFTRADSPPAVRLWVSPSTVIVTSGQPVTLKVMAAVDPKTVIIPSLSFSLIADPTLSVSPVSLTYNSPLQGQAIIGEISVTAVEEGQYTVGISEESVAVGGNINLAVSSAKATVIAK